MPSDLHYICKHGLNHRHLGEQMHESGDWTASDDLASQAVGGRFYLHEHQKGRAWHGGTIVSLRFAPDGRRKVFIYKVDREFRVGCPGKWARQKAVVRR